MTQKHLYPNKFYNWPGWDLMKWLLAALICVISLYIIWTVQLQLDPMNVSPWACPAKLRGIVEAVDTFFTTGI